MATITKAELMDMARSKNPADRQRALELYQAWVKAAPKLDERDRLNATERMILSRLFENSAPRSRR